jgi:hypothetical protein
MPDVPLSRQRGPPTVPPPPLRDYEQPRASCPCSINSTLGGGTFSYSGTITATGGTGVYKNVHGTASANGTTLTSDPDAGTFNITGTFKY